MKLQFKALLAATAVLAVAAVGCKKDSTQATYNYLDGGVYFDAPSFVAAGDVIDVTPSGISHPDDEPYGYYWTVSSLKTARDTSKTLSDDRDGHFTFTVPDTVGTFTLTVTAFADDYYPSSGTVDFTILHPTKSLTETGMRLTDPQFTDTRDGYQYYYSTMGGVDWMRQNLMFAGAGASYDGCAAADLVFGRYYTWDEAQTVCPTGWRLPTDAEWTALVAAASGETELVAGKDFPAGAGSLMGKAKLNTAEMWEYWPEVNITDAVGFCALPMGYGNLSTTGNGNFTGLGNYAAFWTADAAPDASQALYRYINVRRDEVYLGAGDKKTFAASVRCVR